MGNYMGELSDVRLLSLTQSHTVEVSSACCGLEVRCTGRLWFTGCSISGSTNTTSLIKYVWFKSSPTGHQYCVCWMCSQRSSREIRWLLFRFHLACVKVAESVAASMRLCDFGSSNADGRMAAVRCGVSIPLVSSCPPCEPLASVPSDAIGDACPRLPQRHVLSQ